MQYEEISWYSERLGKNMNIKIYGHYGQSVLAFPCQHMMSNDFYNNGMIDALSPLIESGRMKLFCVDAIDDESTTSSNWDQGYRGYKLEMYHQYIVNEVISFIRYKQGGEDYPFVVGMSSGALHASSVFFRRPELFKGLIAISGRFDSKTYFPDYVDNNIYNYFPIDFLRNMNWDHPYINIYNQKRIIVNVGQGAFEDLVLDSNYALVDILRNKGISVEFHLWDHNAIHDWPTWRYSLSYFLSQVL